MKKLFYVLGGGLVGGAIGWVIGEVLAYQIYEKKQLEMEEYVDLVVNVEYKEEEGKDLPNNNLSKSINVAPERKIITNYVEKYKEGKLKLKPATDDELVPDPLDQRQFPAIVSESQWIEAGDEYERVNLCYYEEDDVFTDSSDKILEIYEDLIGEDALTSFGQESNDPDVVYIQNEEEMAIYEIIRLHGSYEELVLGFKKPTQKKKRKPKAKVKPIEDEDDETEED